MPRLTAPLDWRIAALVDRLGRRIVTMAELSDVGASTKEVLGRCHRRVFRRIHAGVYLVGAGALTWQEQILAAVLAGGETARAADFAALRLYELGDFAPRPIQVSISHGTTLRARGVVARRTRRVVPSRVVQGVPTVCVEEALLGVAHKLPTKTLHRLLTSAWRRRLTTPKKVLLYLRKNGTGVRGSAALRAVAVVYADLDRGPGSEAEADFYYELFTALEAYGIEMPEMQFKVKVRGDKEVLVPDFIWPLRWKIVEILGQLAHGDYISRDEDSERVALLKDAGYEVEEVAARGVRERPRKIVERIMRYLQTPNAHWPGAFVA